MQSSAWLLIGIGLMMALSGIIWLLMPVIPWLGHLPGAIVIERDTFHVDFPLATTLLISLLLALIVWGNRYSSR